jgi:hypothetical protein
LKGTVGISKQTLSNPPENQQEIRMTLAVLASIIAACILALVAGFQVLLALAKPYGRAAWGGVHRVLPVPLRFASAVSALLLILAAWIVLARTGTVSSPWQPATLQVGTWVCFGFMTLSTIGNLASKSLLERKIMFPTAFSCAVCIFVVAISAST